MVEVTDLVRTERKPPERTGNGLPRRERGAANIPPPAEALEALGLAPDTSLAQVKSRYDEIARSHDPNLLFFRDIYRKILCSVLGVSDGVSREDVRKVYLDLSKKFHPDRNPNAPDQERFKDIGLAYDDLVKIILQEEEEREVFLQMKASRRIGEALKYAAPKSFIRRFLPSRGRIPVVRYRYADGSIVTLTEGRSMLPLSKYGLKSEGTGRKIHRKSTDLNYLFDKYRLEGLDPGYETQRAEALVLYSIIKNGEASRWLPVNSEHIEEVIRGAHSDNAYTLAETDDGKAIVYFSYLDPDQPNGIKMIQVITSEKTATQDVIDDARSLVQITKVKDALHAISDHAVAVQLDSRTGDVVITNAKGKDERVVLPK